MLVSRANEPVVTSEHTRQLHLCSKGMRAVIVQLYGKKLWRKFILQGGALVSELEPVSHPDILAAIELAKKEFKT